LADQIGEVGDWRGVGDHQAVAEILDGHAHLTGWWRALREHPSVAQIVPPTATCSVAQRMRST
jgi:hypothetical protein